MPNRLHIDRLAVEIHADAEILGRASADFVAQHLTKAIQANGFANIILATGTSQFTFLTALKALDIDWKNINVFHLDEYIGLADTHPASFRKYLKERILDEVLPGQVYLLQGDAKDIAGEMQRYRDLLKEHPIDIACIGIGENGHIAFNDPPVADFEDPEILKVVELDEDCRNQQLGEGWFPNLNAVPKTALTLTIPTIMKSKVISCVVPEARKAPAVERTLFGEIHTSCPASILRQHPEAILFLDPDSAGKI